MRAEARREVEGLLDYLPKIVGKNKKLRGLIEKFSKTQTLSKKEVKILRDIARRVNAQVLAA